MSAGRAAVQEAAGGARCQPGATLGGAGKVGSEEEERGSGERQRPGPARLGSVRRSLPGAPRPECRVCAVFAAAAAELLYLFIYLFISLLISNCYYFEFWYACDSLQRCERAKTWERFRCSLVDRRAPPRSCSGGVFPAVGNKRQMLRSVGMLLPRAVFPPCRMERCSATLAVPLLLAWGSVCASDCPLGSHTPMGTCLREHACLVLYPCHSVAAAAALRGPLM